MIIKKTEIFIDLDNALPEELRLPSFSKKITAKAAKKSVAKKSATRKVAGKKNELWGISRSKKRTPGPGAQNEIQISLGTFSVTVFIPQGKNRDYRQ